jgi:stage II sporulation protein AA (anti-sigma F factor antagonist)
LLQITVTTHGAIIAIEPAGSIDARASREFEREALARLAAGTRHVIVDLSKVESMTSYGIRVLLLLSQRLQAVDGALVLCALNEQTQSEFEVSRLAQGFQFVPTQADALRALSAVIESAPAAIRTASKLCRMAARLIEDTERIAGKRLASASPPMSGAPELARAVASLLALESPDLR